MVRIGIVEDDEGYRAEIREFLSAYTREYGESFDVKTFSNGEELTFDYRPEFDILLMDIEMPKMDGMTAARLVRKQDSAVTIIFITNMAQYAIEGYSVQARAYILKPLNYVGFCLEIQNAIASLSRRTGGLMLINTADDLVKLPEGRIIYIETDGHDLIFHTADGNYRTRSTMKEMEEKLSGHFFARPSVSYLVNLAHVSGISGDMVNIEGEKLPISRQRRKDFIAALTDYVGRT